MHALPVHLHHQVLRDAKIALSVLCCGRRSKAKVDRVYKGRKASIDDQELRRLVGSEFPSRRGSVHSSSGLRRAAGGGTRQALVAEYRGAFTGEQYPGQRRPGNLARVVRRYAGAHGEKPRCHEQACKLPVAPGPCRGADGHRARPTGSYVREQPPACRGIRAGPR